MKIAKLTEEFENYLLSSYSLEKNELDRLIEDLSGAFSETVDEFIHKRHIQLQSEGLRNGEIYKILQKEIKTRLFHGPNLSERQIRRVIYG